MELLGLSNLATKINNWLARNGFDYTAEIGDEFEYLPLEGIIHYCLCYSTDTEKYFNRVLEDCGLEYECDSFITSFFHELFHGETWDDFTDEEIEEYLDSQEKMSEYEADSPLHEAYFYWPVEYAATKAAVDYINSHETEVREFWEEVQPAIQAIYILNNVNIATAAL